MNRLTLISIIIVLVISFTSCNDKIVDDRINITVSIPTLKYILEQMTSNDININIAIPPGYSPSNYSPTPLEMENLSNSIIYFSLGLPAEEAGILDKAKSLNQNIKIIELDKYVDSIIPPRMFNEEKDMNGEEYKHEGRDPHIWLSTKRMEIIINKIYSEIIKLKNIDKENALINKNILIEKNKDLNIIINDILVNTKDKTVIVYHPSIGYFTDEYNISMKVIEEEGKEAFAKALEEIIDFAKSNNIKNILYQKEFDSSQPKTIAREIGGEAISYRPLGENYFEIMEEIALIIKEAVSK